MNLLSLDKMMLLFGDMNCSITSLLSLDTNMILLEVMYIGI